MDRRGFLTSTATSAAVVTASMLLGDPSPASGQVSPPVLDVNSFDPIQNSSWPYASDGLLYNFVSGTVLTVEVASVTVLISDVMTGQVTVTVPPGTEIYCRASLASSLSAVIPGDRIEICTSFVGQGRRQANWIVVNGLAGWSDVAGFTNSTILMQPSSNYGSSNGIVSLAVMPEPFLSG